MNSLDLPQILYQPFAATGDKNTILDSPSTTAPQRANLQTGFPPITQIPIDNGGIPPERMDFNGLGYLLSSFYFFTQCGGVYTFNRNVSNAIGGYPLGAVLYYTDSNGTTYKVRSLLENNTFDFVTTPSYIDDEHWEYVSSTPITQDTSASSTSNVFSTAAVQSLLNTVVHLTGTQSISGTKTFTSPIIARDSLALACDDPDITKGTAPTQGENTVIRFRDKNGNNVGAVFHHYATDKGSATSIQSVKANTSSDTASANLTIHYPASGDPYATAPASDVNGSIVTTVNKSKSAKGYFKLGNGLIIQWGSWNKTDSSPVTINFSTPFTGTPRVVTQIYYDARANQSGVTAITTTSFALYHASDISGNWIAIGY